jgi:hypothetical protein
MTKAIEIHIIIMIIFFILSGCQFENQKPAEAFVGGQFPKILRQLANPVMPRQDDIKLDDSSATIRVAVIDDGDNSGLSSY